MAKIKAVATYLQMPHIVKTSDGEIYQLSYVDKVGRFRKSKLLLPKKHNGSLYYRIGKQRLSEHKLQALEVKYFRVINLNSKSDFKKNKTKKRYERKPKLGTQSKVPENSPRPFGDSGQRSVVRIDYTLV